MSFRRWKLARGARQAPRRAGRGARGDATEFESRGRRRVDERRDHRLEEIGRDERAGRLGMDEACAHRGLLADDREEASVRRQLREERFRQHRRGRGQHDRVVGVAAEPASTVSDFDAHVREPLAGERRARLFRGRRIDLDRGDVARLARHQGGEVACARADLEHAIALPQHELLQHARFHLRRPHPVAVPERQFEIGQRERPISLRHEVLAVHGKEQVEHARVEHVPGTDLLLDHVEARLLVVESRHRGTGASCVWERIVRKRRRRRASPPPARAGANGREL
jgi:hypothetical protein